MTAAQPQKLNDDNFGDTLRQILLAADGDTLKQMVLNLGSNSGNKGYDRKKKSKYKLEPWMLIKKEPSEPNMK